MIIRLIVSVAACLGAGLIGSLFTFKAIPGWYAGLKKPRFTPPNRVFGPVWTMLYILMSIAVFLIWQTGLKTDYAIMVFSLFWIQLAFNIAWSIVFFGAKSQIGALFIIVCLWLLILAVIITALRVATAASLLLLPYLLWVSVATYLNWGIWAMNKRHSKGIDIIGT
jgi:translocator protein